MRSILLALSMLAAVPGLAQAACLADSGDALVPLVELYTSEGCDSCPPADRWLSGTFPPAGAPRASVLAFHVDYWDRLGWVDRFAHADYTARQYAAMRANRATFVYTPQVLLQGRDHTGWRRGSAADALAAAASRPPRARLSLAAKRNGEAIEATLDASLAAGAGPATVALAYTDSRLESVVRAGENRGETLVHDHVVRHLAAQPLRASQREYRFTVPRPREAGEHAKLVAFVQQDTRGDVLQSVTLDLAGCR